MAKKEPEPAHVLFVRVDPALWQLVNAHAQEVRKKRPEATRSDVVRELLRGALAR